MAESTQLQLQLEQVATILGPDPLASFKTLISYLLCPSYFESLISSSLFSSNSEQRSRAELVYNLFKKYDPDSLSLTLAHLLQFSPAPDSRFISAVLLRNQIHLWPSLSENTQSTIKSALLFSIQRQDNTKSISGSLCDAVSALAAGILQENGWPELLPFLFASVSADSLPPILQESAAFLIFAQLSPHLLPYINELHTVFLSCLSSSTRSDEVKIAAFSAVVNFIRCLPYSEDEDRFHDVLIEMMRTVMGKLNKGKEIMAQEAIKLFIELAGTHPSLLSRNGQIIRAMLQIAEAIDVLEQGTRHLAIEFLITLAKAGERAPWIMRNSVQFVGLLFSILMRMVSDVEDDPLWHKAETDDEYAGVSADYRVGNECLHRLAIALGGNDIVPVALKELPACFASNEWKKHNAALVALAQISEGCSKVMIKDLEQVVAMVLNSFEHSHIRVRRSAINAVGQLSTYLAPDLQVQYHQQVFSALNATIYGLQNRRLLAHAASALQKFIEKCARDILTPYLDEVFSQLVVLLQSEIQMVQVEALTALASVVVSFPEQFQKYYEVVMIPLRAMLLDAANNPVWSKSVACISLVGMAVGKEKFRDDAKKVMEVLLSFQGSQMEPDDPTASCMLQICADLCKCLGQDFLPYMGAVMPPLLQFVQIKPVETVISANDNSDMDESDDESTETITLGDKRIRIKTSALEEKVASCNLLCCYADELKEGFFPWIDQVAPTLVPLLSYIHEKVRKSAVSAMLKLLLTAKLAVDRGQAQGCNETYLKKLSDYIVRALVEALPKEDDSEICTKILDAINECIQLFGSTLDESLVKSIKEIKQVITPRSSKKRVSRKDLSI
ncbi:putative TOG domain-containing protein [Rosa chinensis]|uniref:Putative TOG domain-containing protein n=1 Tax=Rosa chinensis TaxID=74649 RepID=A0A2P6QG27_ROSCH|nr:importin-5 isoform X2 [Rosa chinensis]PRQ33130.1 putative TOG domain-containing protein [Rosa chinensis]